MTFATAFATAFATISERLSTRYGGPYHVATVLTVSDAVVDAGGSIVTPGGVVGRPCRVQVDNVTEAMRGDDGFTAKDVRLLVLTATLDGDLDTDATIDVTDGPHAGTYSLQTATRDPLGVYIECRARPRG